jgi:beta-galactosidase
MNFPHIIYGGDYNPEQWPDDVWLEDARLMQEAGVNLVSLGIFAWSKLQPAADIFNFDWLDRLMDLLHEHGVGVNLATPTASPPPWLVRLHPGILPVTDEGTTLWHGARRHYCPHSPAYHEHVDRMVSALADRYKSHPALMMWHVDNEYASGITECFCEHSAIAFREWLKEKYISLDQLNQAWGTAFWSQSYGDWEEIHPPRKAPSFVNPTQRLDWARFNSDSWIACFERQKAILNHHTPQVPVTTNFMGFHKPVDYWKFAAREDLVSNDNYPDMYDPQWMVGSGMICDLMRSLGNRRPWVLMEQATSLVNWRQRNATKREGLMRLCSYQAIARGADGIMFFQWRASRAGSEKHHSAMLPHQGTDSRVWREVKAFGSELPKLAPIISSQVRAEVAFLFDWDNWWALELDGKPSNDLRLMAQTGACYESFFKRNITVDFVHPRADLSSYKLVVSPNLYLAGDHVAENLNRYVKNGGNLIMSFFSGIVDENEHIHPGGYPGPLSELLGLSVEEFAPYSETQSNSLCTTDGRRFGCSFWSEVIHLKTAQPIAKFAESYFGEDVAFTHNQFGSGNAFYLGSVPDAQGMDWLVAQACEVAGVKSVGQNVPPGIEVLQRVHGDDSWLFLLNHAGEAVRVPLQGPGQDLLTGRQVTDAIDLDPMGVAVIQLLDRS